MNCPNCGAALQVVPNRTHLSCPYCQSLHFPEPIAEGVVPLDEDHPFQCPCCERPLAAAALDGDAVGYCTACRGILLSSDHFAQVIASRREVNGRRHRRVEPIDPTEFRRISRCPRCGRRTDTHTYGGGGNAVIDSCHRCHLVWLDAGELTVLEQFPAKAPVVSDPGDWADS
jgi:Zn-finger nucleic acid-binding protein